MPAPKSFTLPRDRTWPRWWLAVSLAAHLLVLSLLVEWSMTAWHNVRAQPGRVVVMMTPPLGRPTGAIAMLPDRTPRRVVRETAEPQGAPPAPPLVAPPVPVVRDTLPPPPPAAPAAGGPIGGRALAAGGGRPGGGAGGFGLGPGGASITPEYGNGMLWVRPMEEVAAGESRPIRLDSAVALRLRAMADSIEKHPFPDPNANPYVSKPWTFTVGGKTYGIDSKGIHLGDFTIPTAVLALLAMPQGNIDQARANQAYMAMRADLLRAAARAQTEADFREAVREIRARKQAEHDAEKQRQQQQPVQP